MTWGPLYFYYHCSECGFKFKYAFDIITEYGDEFGCCPKCGIMGVYEKDGPRQIDDAHYYEVD